MVSGQLIEPPARALAPYLTRSLRQVRAFDLGFDEMSHTVVRRLRAGSQAALAELADDDLIDSLDNLRQARKEQDAMLSLQITRDSQQLPGARTGGAGVDLPVYSHLADLL